MIDKFEGRYAFLSNFFECNVFGYRTLEHAYQASKCLYPQEALEIAQCHTPGQAKRLGRTVCMHPRFEENKLDIMEGLIKVKFSTMNEALMLALVTTGDEQLVEGNTWGDEFWGFDTRTQYGLNHLGILLMARRSKLQAMAPLIPKDIMPKIDGKSFRCDCGGNVFRSPLGQPLVFVCNSCGERYKGAK